MTLPNDGDDLLTYFPDDESFSLFELVVAQRGINTLTPRENEILSYIRDGLTAKQIARKIGCSHRTVELHREHIKQKLGTNKTSRMKKLVEYAFAYATCDAASEQYFLQILNNSGL